MLEQRVKFYISYRITENAWLAITGVTRLYFFSERVISNWNNLDQSQSLRLAAWIHSNGVYMTTTEMSRWTYSWINIRMVLGRIRSLLLVRPYQVNNQVNNFVVMTQLNWFDHNMKSQFWEQTIILIVSETVRLLFLRKACTFHVFMHRAVYIDC